MDERRPQIAVIGAATAEPSLADLAFEVGRRLGKAGLCLLTGGRGGVMDAASRGARAEGGLVVGVLPGSDAASSPPNGSVDVALFTGLGQARNLVLVLSADAVIAIGGGWGTLSEIALARKSGRPVVLLDSWDLERPGLTPDTGLHRADSAAKAVEIAIAEAKRDRHTC